MQKNALFFGLLALLGLKTPSFDFEQGPFSPPTLPAKVLQSVDRYLDGHMEAHPPSSGIPSSDGSTLVFNWNVTGNLQVWKTQKKAPFPLQLTGGQEYTKVMGLSYDDRQVFISRDYAGENNPGLYVQNILGGPLIAIQHSPKVHTELQYVSRKKPLLYFRANDLKNDSYALYQLNYRQFPLQKELIFSRPGIWEIMDVWEEKNLFLLSKKNGALTNEVYLFDLISKTLTPLLGQKEWVNYQVNFSHQSNVYWVLTNKFNTFKHLYLWDGKNFSDKSKNEKDEIIFFKTTSNRQLIFISWMKKFATRFDIRSPEMNILYRPGHQEAENFFLGHTSINERYLSFSIDQFNRAPESFLLDLKTFKTSSWKKISSPELDLKKFVKAKYLEYPAKDGTKIPIFVRIPPECQKKLCPIVTYFHGGPEGMSTPGFNLQAQIFVDQGYIYAAPNVRGSDGLGKFWISADNGPKRLQVISDIADAATFLRQYFSRDSKSPKIAVTGDSYGGYATLMAMTYFSGSFDAGVSVVGMSNLITFLNNTAPYRRALRIPKYGDPVKDAEALKELSPINHIHKIQSPLLMFHGLNDPKNPVTESIQMFEKCQKLHRDCQLVVFPDEGHGFKKRKNRLVQIALTLDFLQKHLKMKESIATGMTE